MITTNITKAAYFVQDNDQWTNIDCYRMDYLFWFIPVVKIKQVCVKKGSTKYRWVWLSPLRNRNRPTSSREVKIWLP